MDKKLEVGEYVRYMGEIDRVEQMGNTYYWASNGIKIEIKPNIFNKCKHSKNIIDLVEVGDYVNGIEVMQNADNTELEQCDGIYHKCILVRNSYKYKETTFKVIDFEIKEILTHEQYDNNKFEV